MITLTIPKMYTKLNRLTELLDDIESEGENEKPEEEGI